eukprot:TRINITY_DN2942_c0_g1_i4.p1 TRINITY_DN2942_c0_g1~~TRINITY_DN2942_c0_g1_i4.p1  ORF type:complete len:627 (+),score=164.81 TRINITY_DN2942_c0_g1_i4:91-1971(+)
MEPRKIVKTFANQDSLPPLPVPALESILDKYLKSVVPALTKEEYENTERIVRNFAKSEDAQRLHRKLQERSKELWSLPEKKNWLEDWWFQYAYLIWPDPIPVSSNYYMVFNEEVIKKNEPQALQAAKMLKSLLFARGVLKREEIPAEYMGKTPLCMNQYRAIFTTARIPGENQDVLLNTEPTSKVTVLYRSKFHLLDLLDGQGKELTVEQLETQIGRIIFEERARTSFGRESDEGEYGMGILTGGSRPEWAKLRKLLEKNENNARILNQIDRSLAVLCLEDTSPKDDEDLARICFVENPNNRWYDKILQLVVFANGRAGVNGEHSPLDAPSSGNVCDLALEHLKKMNERKVDGNSSKNGKGSSPLPMPERLEWTVDSSSSLQLSEGMKGADQIMKQLSKSVDLKRLVFDEFGSDWMKSTKLSPDSTIQLVLQLAYAKIYGKSVPTYETAQIRQFRHGRTEICRTFSVTSNRFTETMMDPKATGGDRWKAFSEAIEAHKEYMKDAVNGKGCDRTLLALKILATEENRSTGKAIPEFFTDKAYSLTSSGFKMSTSNMPTIHYTGGFGPAVFDGYGICYQPWKNTINFSITSNATCSTTSSDRMRSSILQSLREIRDLVESSNSQSSKL